MPLVQFVESGARVLAQVERLLRVVQHLGSALVLVKVVDSLLLEQEIQLKIHGLHGAVLGVAERLERRRHSLVETRVAVLERMLGIIPGAFLKPLFAISEFIIADHCLGGLHGTPAAVMLRRIEELSLMHSVSQRGQELAPDILGAIHVLPDIVVGISEPEAVCFSDFDSGLGCVESARPFIGAVRSADDSSGGIVGIVEQGRCSDKGEAGPQGLCHNLVSAALPVLQRKEFVRLIQILQDFIHALVERSTLDAEFIGHRECFLDERDAAVTLDHIGICPCAQEVNLAEEPVPVGRIHLGAFLDLGDEVVHIPQVLVGAVPDIQDGGAGVMGCAAFFHIYYVVRIHGAGCDVTGGGAAIAEITLIRNAADIALLEEVRKHGIH